MGALRYLPVECQNVVIVYDRKRYTENVFFFFFLLPSRFFSSSKRVHKNFGGFMSCRELTHPLFFLRRLRRSYSAIRKSVFTRLFFPTRYRIATRTVYSLESTLDFLSKVNFSFRLVKFLFGGASRVRLSKQFFDLTSFATQLHNLSTVVLEKRVIGKNAKCFHFHLPFRCQKKFFI